MSDGGFTENGLAENGFPKIRKSTALAENGFPGPKKSTAGADFFEGAWFREQLLAKSMAKSTAKSTAKSITKFAMHSGS